MGIVTAAKLVLRMPQPTLGTGLYSEPPLRAQHCLRGLEKAAAVGFLDVRGGAWRFDIAEYEHYEQARVFHSWPLAHFPFTPASPLLLNTMLCTCMLSYFSWGGVLRASHNSLKNQKIAQVENGDLNWIVPGKLVAFSGPAARPSDYVGFRAMVPEDYWGYYHRRLVTAVVRLNKKARL